MKSHDTVDAYVDAQGQSKEAIELLREIALESGMKETVKWGGPVYTVKGKNVIGLGSFKSYVGVWFFQGALLKDEKKLLATGTEGVTQAMRQLRFKSIDDIDRDQVKAYIMEAIDNQMAGKEVKLKKKKEMTIPQKLADALAFDRSLKEKFEAFFAIQTKRIR